jgi:3D (Asp-Asp-Asp) domain-containing protein
MKLLEKILIVGICAILGVGIYFSTKCFYDKIENGNQHTDACQHEVVEVEPEQEVEETKEEVIVEITPQKTPTTTVEQPKQEIATSSNIIEKDGYKLQSLGVYKLTAYCSCAKCCGKTDGITASGTHVTAGRTIAAPKIFAFGTKIMRNGHVYTVEDRGGAIQGNRIDIYFDTH